MKNKFISIIDDDYNDVITINVNHIVSMSECVCADGSTKVYISTTYGGRRYVARQATLKSVINLINEAESMIPETVDHSDYLSPENVTKRAVKERERNTTLLLDIEELKERVEQLDRQLEDKKFQENIDSELS